ncbi:hypothetical protein [Nostoc sp. ChiQUE01b]|uniref:hypothetical protein n=1 Tax=Nostoc sp. ChiQUE01b TaxID=3075376 RepID=UPI002AD260C7|nr:hypothetical protein [Nostoc sp. ChiQUE01b]MDZ8260412.1 hypothetical protein [Nostoc sp. ChiQUE01b]
MKNITVTFQKHDGTAERTENISLDVKLSEFRKAAQILLRFPYGLPFVLILDRTKKELGNDGTFKDAGIQQNDKIILYPLPVWEKQKDKFVPPTPKPQPKPVQPEPVIPTPTKTKLETLPLPIPNPPIKRQPTNNQPVKPNIVLRLVGVTAVGAVLMSVYPNLFTVLSSAIVQSPEQSIQDYYSDINNQKLAIAWNRLSPKFQNGVSYSEYLEWWGRKVERVKLNQISLVSQDNKSAVVELKLQYFMKKTQSLSPPESLRLWLVWDDQNSKWMINKSQRISQ